MATKVILSILKTAATRIPWGKVVQNAPMVVDLVERVKDRLQNPPAQDLYTELKANREEHLKLADTLLQTNAEVEELKKALEVVAARQKMLMTITVISLLIALSSLIAWLAS